MSEKYAQSPKGASRAPSVWSVGVCLSGLVAYLPVCQAGYLPVWLPACFPARLPVCVSMPGDASLFPSSCIPVVLWVVKTGIVSNPVKKKMGLINRKEEQKKSRHIKFNKLNTAQFLKIGVIPNFPNYPK